MSKLEQQYGNLAEKKRKFDMGFKESAKELEGKLKRMGIELPYRGPRISDRLIQEMRASQILRPQFSRELSVDWNESISHSVQPKFALGSLLARSQISSLFNCARVFIH